jgi:hypothetical protein
MPVMNEGLNFEEDQDAIEGHQPETNILELMQSREKHPGLARRLSRNSDKEYEDDDIVIQNSSREDKEDGYKMIRQQSSLITEKEERKRGPLPTQSSLVTQKKCIEQRCSQKKETDSTIIKHHDRMSYFSSQSLSDDRWLCPICLDIYTDAVETPCCHNLFCEACIVN